MQEQYSHYFARPGQPQPGDTAPCGFRVTAEMNPEQDPNVPRCPQCVSHELKKAAALRKLQWAALERHKLATVTN